MSTIQPTSAARSKIVYPDSDGKPMAETGKHAKNMLMFLDILRKEFEGQNNAVEVNMFLYYVEGDPKKVVSPDVFVILGRPEKDRRSYFVWEEGKVPDLIIELTSRSSRRTDTEKKFRLYRDVLQIREYILFDPFEEYLKPSMQGYRLINGDYQPIAPIGDRLPSEILGLHFGRRGDYLRLYRPDTGEIVPTGLEFGANAFRELQRAEAELHQALAESQRVERERQQAVAESQRVERERQQAVAERQQAVTERQAMAERLGQAEVEREQLLAEIDRLRRQSNPG